MLPCMALSNHPTTAPGTGCPAASSARAVNLSLPPTGTSPPLGWTSTLAIGDCGAVVLVGCWSATNDSNAGSNMGRPPSDGAKGKTEVTGAVERTEECVIRLVVSRKCQHTEIRTKAQSQLTGYRGVNTFARGSSIRGTVTGCLRFREDQTSRGFLFEPVPRRGGLGRSSPGPVPHCAEVLTVWQRVR